LSPPVDRGKREDQKQHARDTSNAHRSLHKQ
jgi:hypothetical protein